MNWLIDKIIKKYLLFRLYQNFCACRDHAIRLEENGEYSDANDFTLLAKDIQRKINELREST